MLFASDSIEQALAFQKDRLNSLWTRDFLLVFVFHASGNKLLDAQYTPDDYDDVVCIMKNRCSSEQRQEVQRVVSLMLLELVRDPDEIEDCRKRPDKKPWSILFALTKHFDVGVPKEFI